MLRVGGSSLTLPAMKSGNVAIVGRTNVGKSTLLNALLGEPLAITSPLPQTTRDALLGVLTTADTQIAFLDTPGLHRPRSELGRRMNATALEALRHCDVVLFMTAPNLQQGQPAQDARVAGEHSLIDPDDKRLVAALPAQVPAVLLVNKVDLMRNKRRLLPLLVEFQNLHPFKHIVPISALKQDGLANVVRVIGDELPERAAEYPSDTLTDRPTSFFVREYVREQIMRLTAREVPHAVAITVDRYLERPGIVEIAATIHVEKDGQKGIIVGHGGAVIKKIGTQARLRLVDLLGTKVHLELFVRVTTRWKDAPRMLAELGYEADSPRSLRQLLPGAEPKSHKAAVSKVTARKEAARKQAGPSQGSHRGKSRPQRSGPPARRNKPNRNERRS
ncbi:MAG TPA: GTPase Era [Polyangiaceae bacterium]|nr:GTPase Era [Polyangiaceae bacterium]